MNDGTLILELINDILGKPKKKNKVKSQYAYDCPVCSSEKGLYDGDGKGNLEVNLKKNVFKCWVCCDTHKTQGSLKKLISLFGTKEHKKRIKHLGINTDEISVNKKGEIVITNLTLPTGYIPFKDAKTNDLQYKQAWNYLTKERKIQPDIIYKYNIGYATSGEYSFRIIIPSYSNTNELNYFVSRTWVNQKPKYKNPEIPKEEIIFNEKLINWDSTIYLVEGVFDHIVVHNSIPLLGKKIFNKLKQEINKKANGNIVIILDPDAWENSVEIYKTLNIGRLYGKIRIVKLLDDYDISKINEEFGRVGVVDVLRSSYKLKEMEL